MIMSFNSVLATKYGVRETLLLEFINDSNKGLWVKCSVKDLCEIFPFITKNRMSKAIATLIENGLIEYTYNPKAPMERIRYYKVTEKGVKEIKEARGK